MVDGIVSIMIGGHNNDKFLAKLRNRQEPPLYRLAVMPVLRAITALLLVVAHLLRQWGMVERPMATVHTT